MRRIELKLKALFGQKDLPRKMLMLLLGLVQIAVQHLDDRILAINLALVVLRKDLDVLAQLLHLRQRRQPEFKRFEKNCFISILNLWK